MEKKKDLIDEDANYEDIRFELECEWDKEFNHRNLGFVLRKNSKLDLFYLNGKFCRYMDLKLIDNKEILREPSNETPINK